MEENRDCYFYGVASRAGDINKLYRINVRKLVESSSPSTSSSTSERRSVRKLIESSSPSSSTIERRSNETDDEVDFEFVFDLAQHGYPYGMKSVIVNSKVYLVGGEYMVPNNTIPNGVGCNCFGWATSTDNLKEWENCNIFALDIDSGSIFMDKSFPKLSAPKPRPIVFTHLGQVYALARNPCFARYNQLRGPTFELFDPDNASSGWKPLPDPPFFEGEETPDDTYVLCHYFLKDKLFIFTEFDLKTVYIYYTSQEKWEKTDSSKRFIPYFQGGVVEYKDFIIAMSRPSRLATYKLDLEGFPIEDSFSNLEDLNYAIFGPYGDETSVLFMAPLGCADRICLVFDVYSDLCTVAAVFRVSSDGRSLTAIVEAVGCVNNDSILHITDSLNPAFFM